MNQPVAQFDGYPISGGDLGNVIGRLWCRRNLFAIAVIITMLPICAVVLLWPPVYSASGTVIIGDLEPADSSLAAWIQRLGDPADLESQLLIAKSPRMLRLALERPGITDAIQEECHHRSSLRHLVEASGLGYLLPAADCSKLSPGSEELLGYVGPGFLVRAEGRSRVISIGYRSPLPEVSFMLANALLITYLEDQRAENARARERAAAWVLRGPAKLNEGRSIANSPLTQSKQSFYQDLHRKVTDLETERRSLPNPGRLVSLAEVPAGPYFPKRLPLLAAGFVISAMIAGFLVLRRGPGDQKIRQPRDLQALTSKPVLASLPRTASLTLSPAKMLDHLLVARESALPLAGAVGADWESPLFADAARALYARLLLDVNGKRGASILVASGTRGEGKSSTTMALGRAAAESGRKVLVINCDLRLAAAPAPAERPGDAGLASVLRGEIGPQDAVVQTGVPGLDVIQPGLAVSVPAMLLIDGQLRKLMKWAEQYDQLLLNGPAGFLAYIRALADHAEGVLWCVRWRRTLLSDVRADVEEMHRQRIKLLGFAITMVDPQEMRWYQRNPRYWHV